MLASTIAIVIFGKLSDHYGRKPVFLAGILIFIAGSVLSGISPGMISLILFRGIQGIGGGILMTLSFIMVAEIFPIWERGKYMGVLASVFGIASIIGPVLGGLITETVGWPWTFFLNIPLGLLSLGMVWHWYPDIAPVARDHRIDYQGIIIFVAAMVPLFLGFSLAGSVYSWISPEICGMLGGSLVLFALFVRTQMKAAEPVIAIRMFKNRVFSLSMVAVFLANSLFFAAIIYLPLFVQDVLKASASTAGMVITPMVLSMVLAAIVSGQMISRSRRYKNLALFGFGILGIACGIFAMLRQDTSYGELILGSVLLGYGSGIMHPLFSIAAQNAFSVRDVGVITSSLQFSRNMGATIITPLLGVIMYGALNGTKGSVDLTVVPAAELTHAISLVFDWCVAIVAVGFLITLCLEDTMIADRRCPGNETKCGAGEVQGS
jgi:EmrB/QacA subfamily drug resistance transporter